MIGAFSKHLFCPGGLRSYRSSAKNVRRAESLQGVHGVQWRAEETYRNRMLVAAGRSCLVAVVSSV